MKSALVTGAAGFIGRHISAALLAGGYTVRAVDIEYPDPDVHADGAQLWNNQDDGAEDARDFFREDDQQFDVVVHAAAVVGGREVIDGDPLAQAVNLELDAAMFRWARRTRPGRVVYLSSSSVYPVMLQQEAGGRSLRENAVTLGEPIVGVPDALYGWTKLTGEILAGLARADGVPVTVVRPFSGYGEDQDDCYPFPAFAARALAREDPFVIWGSGDQVRDWIHVDDICAALMIMIRDGIDGPVNLGTGRPTSMLALAARMCATAGYDPDVKTQSAKPSGVAYRVADATRMREFYQPAVSLEDGIERAIKKRM